MDKMQNVNKLFNNKKGINDTSIVMIIIFIFIGSGLILPFVDAEFGIEGSTFDTEKVADDLVQKEKIKDGVPEVSTGAVLTSIGKMFFWSFGILPFWLEGIFTVLRIMLIWILARNFIPFLGGG